MVLNRIELRNFENQTLRNKWEYTELSAIFCHYSYAFLSGILAVNNNRYVSNITFQELEIMTYFILFIYNYI